MVGFQNNREIFVTWKNDRWVRLEETESGPHPTLSSPFPSPPLPLRLKKLFGKRPITRLSWGSQRALGMPKGVELCKFAINAEVVSVHCFTPTPKPYLGLCLSLEKPQISTDIIRFYTGPLEPWYWATALWKIKNWIRSTWSTVDHIPIDSVNQKFHRLGLEWWRK